MVTGESGRSEGKNTVRFFVSYTRKNDKWKKELLQRLEARFGCDKELKFELWQDLDIDIGEPWHEKIQAAISACDFGLLLISYEFFSRPYIRDHELPALLVEDPEIGRCRALPIGLCTLNLETTDLKGVERRQVFRDDKERFFDRCRGGEKDDFAEQLWLKLRVIAKAALERRAAASPSSTPAIPVTAIPATPLDFEIKAKLRAALTDEDLAALLPLVIAAAKRAGHILHHKDFVEALCAPETPLELAVAWLTQAGAERKKALRRQKSDDLPEFRRFPKTFIPQ
jgi:hypothetical protein